MAYTQQLREQLVVLVCEALQRLQPARLSWGTGAVEFPMSRRLPQDGRIVMADNPAGSVDRTVPVLRVAAADGRLLAVLFGCACHNATLTGSDNVIAGDYAGFAQEVIERQHADSLALFLSGCGADANPSPRGSMELARQHGERLAREVDRVLNGPLTPLTGPLVTTFREVALPLQALSREEITERMQWPSAEAVMARQMLTVLEQGGQLPATYRAPLAVWQFSRPDPGRSAGRACRRICDAAAPDAGHRPTVGGRIQQRLLWLPPHGTGGGARVDTKRLESRSGCGGQTCRGRLGSSHRMSRRSSCARRGNWRWKQVGRCLTMRRRLLHRIPCVKKNVRIPLRDGVKP